MYQRRRRLWLPLLSEVLIATSMAPASGSQRHNKEYLPQISRMDSPWRVFHLSRDRERQLARRFYTGMTDVASNSYQADPYLLDSDVDVAQVRIAKEAEDHCFG